MTSPIQESGSPSTEKKRTRLFQPLFGQTGVFAAVGALLAGIAAVIAIYAGHSASNAAGPVTGPTTTPTGATDTPTTPPLTLLPPAGSIGFCYDVTGTGTIPDYMSLLIFDRELVGDSHNFWFNGMAHNTPTGWELPNIQFGNGTPAGTDTGKRFEVSAVLVPTSESGFIGSIQTGAGASWWANQLPDTAATKITVVRDAGSTPCS